MKCIVCNKNLVSDDISSYCRNNNHFYYSSKKRFYIYFILKEYDPNIEFYFNLKEFTFEINKNDNCMVEIDDQDMLIKINNVNIDYNNFEELKKYAIKAYENLLFL